MLGTIFLSEVVGTAMLMLLGCGVVANVSFKKSNASGAGFTHINWAWGFAVFCGVLASYKSGGHLNPAVTLGIAATGAEEFVPGVAVNVASIFTYIAAQMVGAFIGAWLVWLAFMAQFQTEDLPGATTRGMFCTAPQIRNTVANLMTEIIATFVLVFVVLAAGKFTLNAGDGPANLGWLGALGVGLLVVVIGMSLGGPTGYAINPARDLGPRIAYLTMPLKGEKADGDWGYAWIPIVGPIIGGVIAGLLGGFLLP